MILIVASTPALFADAATLSVRPITLAGQPAVELRNDLVRAQVLAFGMRIVRFERLADGHNAYVFREDDFVGYHGDRFVNGGEKEMLFPNERWPKHGVWEYPSQWETVRETGDAVTVRFAVATNGWAFAREMTLRAGLPVLFLHQTLRNTGDQPRVLGISPHPEVAVGGGGDSADVLLYFQGEKLQHRDFELGREELGFSFPVSKPVWGVHDAGRRETYGRLFTATDAAEQYIYIGPYHYNLEEVAPARKIAPGESITTDRQVFLLAGLPRVDAMSTNLFAALVPAVDVCGDTGTVSIGCWLASPQRLVGVTGQLTAGRHETAIAFPVLTNGQAQSRHVEVPASALAEGDNTIRLRIESAGGEPLDLAAIVTKNPALLAAVERDLERVRAYVGKADAPTAPRDRAAVRQLIHARVVRTVLAEAEAAYRGGRVREAARRLAEVRPVVGP